jgi:hypothetical protein
VDVDLLPEAVADGVAVGVAVASAAVSVSAPPPESTITATTAMMAAMPRKVRRCARLIGRAL